MKSLRLVAASLLGHMSLIGVTQITPVGDSNNYLELNTTCSSGLKWQHRPSAGTIILYELDLSNPLTITPVVQPGFQVTAIGYVSEDLFDVDPGTTEYLTVYNQQGGSPSGVSIYRTDGTLLFDQYPLIPYGINELPRIHNTGNGTFMLLDSCCNQINSAITKLFLLPGTLPCYGCSGELVLGQPGTDMSTTGRPELLAFPNPANDDATIRYDLPPGASSGSLVLFNIQGAEVKRMDIKGSGTVRITTADLPAATYLYRIESNKGTVGAKRLAIVR
jgi:hypothetical protein